MTAPDQQQATESLRLTEPVIAVLDRDGRATRAVAVGDAIEIGRDPSCRLALGDGSVSRRHAVVARREEGCELEDLGSTNGTLVNGAPIIGPVLLYDGDIIEAGGVKLRFAEYGLPELPDAPQGVPPQRFDGRTQRLSVRPRRRPVREVLRASPAVTTASLSIAVLGSVVGTVLPSLFKADRLGTAAAAAIGPIITATFTSKRAGERGRVRALAITVLSAAALLITFTGFTLPELAAKKPLITEGRSGTFVRTTGNDLPARKESSARPTTRDPAPATAIAALDAPVCDPVALGGPVPAGTSVTCTITVHSTGTAALRVSVPSLRIWNRIT
jgi:hypothetical protein